MFLRSEDDGVVTVSFLLLPEYAMVALLSAIEPLRVANRFAGKELFRWQLLSEDGHGVMASNQLSFGAHLPLQQVSPPRNLFVVSSFHPERYINADTIVYLRRLSRQGAVLGALDTGCFLLAEAGLLKDYKITLHWEAVPAFTEKYPGLEVTNELFEIDRNRITCAGGTSATDLMLHIIQLQYGHEMALKVCEQFIKSGIRQKSDKQRLSLAARLNIHHPRLLRVLALMEDNLENPLSSQELAEQVHISVRQLERLFKQGLNKAPSYYYMTLRVDRARQLLKETNLSVAEVATACGFDSVAHFSRTYRTHKGIAPSEERKRLPV
ncbi:GlxA family transcriptional regulator [Zobellella endophytica]|uniref:GlxA family transcriptional regulator n=1 Tax=Zobellella endophytica TaxID=2116700 RepID=A0A2P7QQW6_9GAMM|nr:GlxA family transcriptional regulator [Zobellella endophytica]PSJ40340.1 GlxA family transcriptional regulator [Zobellella endophytica]